MPEIGEVIKVLRVAQNLTQPELADRAGLHPQAIGQLERGKYSVSLRTLTKIAVALGIPVWKMLRITEKGWGFYYEQQTNRRRVCS